MSEPATIREALVNVSKAVGAVRKDGYNKGQGFNFRGIDHVVNAVHPHLVANGIVTIPVLRSVDYAPVTIGKNATPATSVRVVAGYEFHGPAGDSFTAVVAAEGNDAADKGTAKAMSVALRTALLQTLMLPTDEVDPDSSYDEQVPEYVVLRQTFMQRAQAASMSREDALAVFTGAGGSGKISECTDAAVLRAAIEGLNS